MSRLVGRGQKLGQWDLEASEMAIRTSMHKIGGVVLEKLLNADARGYCGAEVDCGQGHAAGFVDYRWKEVLTVLAPVQVERAYYHCSDCGGGVIPKDRELDIVGTSFSPGVRRMMGRVGSKESFEQGGEDLQELAGIRVSTKQVERVAEEIGVAVEARGIEQRETTRWDKVVPFKPVPKLYITIDGTGVPVVTSETEGRQGKDETGRAKTREAKLGCVFTQTRVEEKGNPVRDPESTSYVGAIETAEAFGPRIYAEAVRRGLRRAQSVIVLGDGAPWIWNIAAEQFLGAIEIVDLYHARQHLAQLGKILYGLTSSESKQWANARYQELDKGDVEAVISSMLRLRSRDEAVRKEVDKTIHYFQTNAERMRYAEFRRQGLFIGSGVMEAGCKTIVGFRLKQSGLRWTVRGANAIIALRCLELSGEWEQFWESRGVS